MCDYCEEIYQSVEELLEVQKAVLGDDELPNVSDGIVYHKGRYDLVLPEVDGTHRAIAYIKYCPFCGRKL